MGVPQPTPIPSMPLAPPQVELPTWTPIPIYRDDIPALNPPDPPPAEPPQEEEETEQPPEQQEPEGPGPSQEILDLVDQFHTPTPQIQFEEPEPAQITTVELPGGYEVPVPRQEILVTAVATAGAAAVASVGATMVAGNLFKKVVSLSKPVIKAVLKKLAKLRKQPAPPTLARQRLGSRLRISGRKRWKDGS